METAAAQLRRILAMIPHLADGKPHTFAEIAGKIGADEATVRHDLRSVSERFGDEPGAFIEGLQLFVGTDSVSMVSNHFLRPMRLTSQELRALELGLAMIRTERPPDEHAVIERARARVRRTLARLPDDPEPALLSHASIGATGSTEHLAAIRGALTSRRKLRVSYRRGGATEASDRTIAPYALAAASGMFYVIAHCDQSEGQRIFRLDRIEAATPLTDPYRIPETFSVDEVMRDGRMFKADEPRTLRVRYSPRIARWIAEREGGTLDADGSLTVERPLADVQWAVRHTLQYGPDAEVLSPPDVREEIGRRLDAAILAATGGAA